MVSPLTGEEIRSLGYYLTWAHSWSAEGAGIWNRLCTSSPLGLLGKIQ